MHKSVYERFDLPEAFDTTRGNNTDLKHFALMLTLQSFTR